MASEGPRVVPGTDIRGGPANLELKPGQPYLGQQGPPGAKFLGWVLVQVWDVPEGQDGCAVQLSSTTGDRKRLMSKAAEKLAQGWPGDG